MAALGASEFRANGTDYTINDPNNANEFSASVAYSAGQYVYYQGILYRFTADHAAGAWNSAHVTQAKLGQDVSDLKSALGAVHNFVDECTKNNFTYNSSDGTFTKGSGTLINMKGMTINHTYRIIINGTCGVSGMRQSTGSTWADTFTFSSFNQLEGGLYYYDYIAGFDGYWFTLDVNGQTPFTKFVIYDITALSQSVKDLLIEIAVPSFLSVLSTADYVIDKKARDILSGFDIIENIVDKFTLNGFTYDNNTAKITPSGSSTFLDIKGLKYARTYRIVIDGTILLLGMRSSIYATWAANSILSFSAFSNNESYFYCDYTPAYDNYWLTIDKGSSGSINRLVIYDITDLTEYQKSKLNKTYTPFIALALLNEEDDETLTNIVVIGDSQTQGGQYANKLASLLTNNDYHVYSYGQGGIDSGNMVAVQGGINIFTNPFTIPSGTTPVEITLFKDFDTGVGAFALQSMQGINPVEIDGVAGNISVTYDTGFTNIKYYFTRATAGEEISIERPAIVRTSLSKTSKGSTLVVWLGTNDSYHKTAEEVKELAESLYYNISNAIKYNGTNNYIVMGLTSKNYMSNVADVNKLLAKMFGNHFLDLRSYILEYGLEDAGIAPTTQDEEDIANGEIPSSLRNDAVHFNNDGYNVIGTLLYKTGKQLGYWE